jgi:hypothetical protein
MRDLAAVTSTNPAAFSRLAKALCNVCREELCGALARGLLAAADTPAGLLAADTGGLARLDPALVAAAAQVLYDALRVWTANLQRC